MNRRFYNPKKDGIKIRSINLCMLILCCVLCAGVFTSAFHQKSQYNTIIKNMTSYARCTKAVNEFRDTSDFLTNQVRLFLVNQDVTYAEKYFHEYYEVQNREKSLSLINELHGEGSIKMTIDLAFKESQDLAQIEMYAMALIYHALNIPEKMFPAELKDIKINAADLLLSDTEKLTAAERLLFGMDYQNSKDKINRYTTIGLDTILTQYLEIQTKDRSLFYRFLLIQMSTIVALFLASVGLFIVIRVLVLRPIDYDIKSIRGEKKMHVLGSYEMRLIAKTYNALREKDEIKASILKHKAEHDPLTGLINREAFAKIKEVLSDTAEPIAYLIIDIDLFKSVNDKYGHLVGDEVLKKISAILSEQFRNTDYVARIGGDEFAVIMTKFGDTPELIIQRKIETINKLLQRVEENIPSVSLSVGVAISTMGYNEILEEQADQALYHVKQGGRCNCSFFSVEH